MTRESPNPRSETSSPDPKASELNTTLDDLNPNTQEQQPESSIQEEDARSREEMELENNHQITSPAKDEGTQEITTHESEAPEELEIPDVHNEPESTTEQDTKAR
jgi:hypothetical protein